MDDRSKVGALCCGYPEFVTYPGFDCGAYDEGRVSVDSNASNSQMLLAMFACSRLFKVSVRGFCSRFLSIQMALGRSGHADP